MSAGRKINTQSVTWNTPSKYVIPITEFFGGVIHLDPCSNSTSIVNAKTNYTLPIDGLKEDWNFPTVFVNPPYGRDKERNTSIKDWIAKAYNSHNIHNNEIIMLIPVATNTKKKKNYIFGKSSAIVFLYDTRLKFLVDGIDDGKGAPMSCSLIYYGDNIDRFTKIFSVYGAVVNGNSITTINHLTNVEPDTTASQPVHADGGAG